MNKIPKRVLKIVRTSCNCHPETCCCGDYSLMADDILITRGDRERCEYLKEVLMNLRKSQKPAP